MVISAYARKADLIFDVVDHGPGIPPEKRGDVFSPFFTTKKEGTGLGLSIVKKIVEAYMGRIEILDNPGGGLTFRVVLPECLEERKSGEEAIEDRASVLKIPQRCYGARIEECAA